MSRHKSSDTRQFRAPVFPDPFSAFRANPGPDTQIRNSYDKRAEVAPEETPNDLSVLIVGLGEAVADVIKQTLGDVKVDYISSQSLYDIKDKHWNEADRRKNSRHGYDIVIVDARTEESDYLSKLNIAVTGVGGRTVFYGVKDKPESCTTASVAEDKSSLEEVLAELNTAKV